MALRLYGERHQMPQQTRVLLGRAYLNSGDAQQAAAVIAPALAALRTMHPQGHPDIARTQGYLARIELRLGHTDQASDLARQQFDFLRAQFPDADNPRVAEAEGLWGECQLAAGQRESGRRSIEHALAVLAKAQPEHPQLSAWRGLLKPK
jgi:tetratricopeptide (TPR) repeat protein